LVAGDSDEIGDSIYSAGKAYGSSKFQPPSKFEEARVKRELTESESRARRDVYVLNFLAATLVFGGL
jgi:hypothetical protein